jgi:hypothetical protein
VHETPELHHVILQRCASEQESSLGVEPQQSLPSLGPEVLDVLSFIQDHVVPFLPSEGKVVLND